MSDFIANAFDVLASRGLSPISTVGFTMTMHADESITASLFVHVVGEENETVEVELPPAFQDMVRRGLNLRPSSGRRLDSSSPYGQGHGER